MGLDHFSGRTSAVPVLSPGADTLYSVLMDAEASHQCGYYRNVSLQCWRKPLALLRRKLPYNLAASLISAAVDFTAGHRRIPARRLSQRSLARHDFQPALVTRQSSRAAVQDRMRQGARRDIFHLRAHPQAVPGPDHGAALSHSFEDLQHRRLGAQSQR